MNKKNKRLFIFVSVIAAIVAIVSLCSIVFLSDKSKEVVKQPQLAGGSSSSEATREIVIEDTTFSSGTLTIKSGTTVTIENCDFTGITTGAIYVESDSTLNLIDCKFYDNTKNSGKGGGSAIRAENATVNINNCYFSNNKTTGSIIGGTIIAMNSEINIQDSTIEKSYSPSSGGAIGITQGSVVKLLGNTVIDGCSSEDKGGAVYLYYDAALVSGLKAGELHIEGNSKIENCSANNGGAIYSLGNIVFNSGLLKNNVAKTNGGAVYIGSGYNHSGSFTFNGGEITGEDENPQAVYGAGVYNEGKFNLSGGVIKGVKSSNNGGGVYNNGEMNYTSGLITLNTSGYHGGGIFSNFNSILNIEGGENSVISENNTTSRGKGGGVYNNGNFTLDGKIINNNADDTGDGISINSGTFTMKSNALITENDGVGIYAYTGTLNLLGGKISKNTKQGVMSSYNVNIKLGNVEICEHKSSESGTGLLSYGKVVVVGNAKIYNNKSQSNGGGIYLVQHSKYESSLTFEENGLLEVRGNSAVNGGGICISSGTMLSLNTGELRISDNTASNNGGGMFLSSSETTLNAATDSVSIILNKANNGGGIYINGSGCSVSINHLYSAENSANNGSAIYVNSGTLFIDDSYLYHNSFKAGEGGTGTIYGGESSNITLGSEGGDGVVEMSGALVAENEKATHGGGIFSKGSLTINKATIHENHVTGNGGAIYFSGDSKELKINDINIYNNTASSGSAIYIDKGTLNLKKGVLNNNHFVSQTSARGVICGTENATINLGVENADNSSLVIKGDGLAISNNGSGIYAGGELTINCATVSNHKTTGNGGAIYSTGDLTIKNVKIDNNSANKGGAIYYNGTGQRKIDKISANNNTATFGGVIYIEEGNLSVDEGCLVGNAADYGGALYGGASSTITLGIDDGSLEDLLIDGGEREVNAVNGGGIFSKGSLTINNLDIINQRTTGNGGAIYYDNSGELLINHLGILYSEARNGAGIYLSRGSLKILNSHNDECIATEAGAGIYACVGTKISTESVMFQHSSAKFGGGIYCEESVEVDIRGSNWEYDFQFCHASNSGGAIFVSANSKLNITNCYINHCSSNNGGGIYAAGSVVNVSDSKIYSSLVKNGGGIYAINSTLTVNNTDIYDTEIRADASTSSGAGIFVNNTNTEIIKTNIYNNGPLNIKDSSMKLSGGGIYSYAGQLTIINSSITQNWAYYGGGIYSSNTNIIIKTDSSISADRTTISQNTSTYKGAGMFITYGSGTLENIDIDENHMIGTGGGGLHLDSVGLLELKSVRVRENTAICNGAGINSSHSKVTIDNGCQITGNMINPTAEQGAENNSGRGAGVLVYAGEFYMNGGMISGNSTNEFCRRNLGAGVYISDGGKFIMTAGEIKNNILSSQYDGYGANVYIKSEAIDIGNDDATDIGKDEAGNIVSFNTWDAEFKMSGGTISGNGTTLQAKQGAGIFNLSVIEITGGTIENCYATYGGGIANYGTMTIGGVKFAGNKADEYGADILNATTLTISGAFNQTEQIDLAMGTSELYGEEKDDQLVGGGDFIFRYMPSNIVFTGTEYFELPTFNIDFYGYIMEYVEENRNIKYTFNDNAAHMLAFYMNNFESYQYGDLNPDAFITPTGYYFITDENGARNIEDNLRKFNIYADVAGAIIEPEKSIFAGSYYRLFAYNDIEVTINGYSYEIPRNATIKVNNEQLYCEMRGETIVLYTITAAYTRFFVKNNSGDTVEFDNAGLEADVSDTILRKGYPSCEIVPIGLHAAAFRTDPKEEAFVISDLPSGSQLKLEGNTIKYSELYGYDVKEMSFDLNLPDYTGELYLEIRGNVKFEGGEIGSYATLYNGHYLYIYGYLEITVREVPVQSTCVNITINYEFEFDGLDLPSELCQFVICDDPFTIGSHIDEGSNGEAYFWCGHNEIDFDFWKGAYYISDFEVYGVGSITNTSVSYTGVSECLNITLTVYYKRYV